MGSHLVLSGPSTAGKTTLMLGLNALESEYDFTVDRTWTTRNRRFSEDDRENVFVDPNEFEVMRHEFLFTFSTFPTYEYGVQRPEPLADHEIRMRILMPAFASKFRDLVQEPTIFCAVSPFNLEPESTFQQRDPNVDTNDMLARLQRFHEDKVDAEKKADIRFQNSAGIDQAVTRLASTILSFINKEPFG